MFRIFNVNAPWAFWTIYRVVKGFIKPATKEKIVFVSVDPKKRDTCKGVEALLEHIPSECLEHSYGGDFIFEYQHDAYWPAFVEATGRK